MVGIYPPHKDASDRTAATYNDGIRRMQTR